MTPSDICVSLEQAKALKVVGFPQKEPLFWWVESAKPYVALNPQATFNRFESRLGVLGHLFAAPTAEEILTKLPDFVEDGRYELRIEKLFSKGKYYWNIGYYGDCGELPDSADVGDGFPDASLANAAAAMYVYLSENNLFPK